MNLFCKLLLPVVLVFRGPAYAADHDTAVLRRLIVAYFDGVARKDFRALDSVSTPDFQIYEFGALWNNDSVFKNIQYHQPFSVTFALTAFRVEADARLGYASYHSHADFLISGQSFQLDFIESAVFRKTAAGWRIALIHVTPLRPAAVTIQASYLKYDTVRYIPGHYRERVEGFRRERLAAGGGAQGGAEGWRGPGNERRVGRRLVMLGDSHMEFGEWKRLFADSGVVNRGIAGDNTFGMLDRLGEVIALRPSALVIEAGINDIGQGVPVDMIAGNIASIVGWVRVKSPGTRIYVVSVLPANERVRNDYPELYGKNAVVRSLNVLLQQQAGETGYVYIDLASRVSDGQGNLDERLAREDGLHLNEEGYKVWMGVLRGMGVGVVGSGH